MAAEGGALKDPLGPLILLPTFTLQQQRIVTPDLALKFPAWLLFWWREQLKVGTCFFF